MQQEKKRAKLAKSSTVQLLRTISQSKGARPQQKLTRAVREDILKREVQGLLEQFENQKKALAEIKTSKKYNRFMEVI